ELADSPPLGMRFILGGIRALPIAITNQIQICRLPSTALLFPSPAVSHANLAPPLLPMSILRRLSPRHLTSPLLLFHTRRLVTFSSTATAAAFSKDTAAWIQAPLSEIKPIAESLYHVSIDVSDSPDLAASHTLPGQYLQLRVPVVDRQTFLAIASPPSFAASRGAFEFLVKSVPGSTAELLCHLKRGDVVELSHAIGKGFEIDRIDPPEKYQAVLIFATGSGISPIRSLIESGFSADRRSDVRLYYGARNLERMAYQDRFKDWESSGVKIIPVLSQPDYSWRGEAGYVQAAYARSTKISNPVGAGAVLCGQRQMAECNLCLLSFWSSDLLK
ncbi:Fruit protein pKIWI502, partial [Linum grandiflorum]